MATAVHRVAPRQLWRDSIYVFGGIILAGIWLTLLWTLVSVGIGLVFVLVGFPMLALTLLLWRWGANRERERATLVLGTPIADAHRPLPNGFWKRWGARLRDPATWKDLLFLGLVGPIVWIVFGAIVVAFWAASLAAILSPVFSASAADGSWLGGLRPAELLGIALAGVLGIVLALAVTRGLAAASGALARGLLAPGDRAELEARVAAVEASRAGAVDSADARLRRIERDLHDGAQHRLAYVAMELGRAREKLADDPQGADRLIAEAHEESKKAMVELRDLARGIHPSVLTDRGLDAAVSALAARTPVPVAVDVDLPHRADPAIEAIAYFVVAEALTNVAKHSGATRAWLTVGFEGPDLVVEVLDDGRGGANPDGGGLRGLRDRVRAVDGRVVLTSPPSGGTTLRVELPCAP
jgi:signal transduction histidine kinase